jgi:hypothetical protein
MGGIYTVGLHRSDDVRWYGIQSNNTEIDSGVHFLLVNTHTLTNMYGNHDC